MSSNFPQVDFNAAYKAPCTIGELFPFKDNIKNDQDMQLVVYKLKCEDCGVEYIGKTKRVLSERLYSHKSLPESAVFQHTKSTGHHVDFAKVQVIDRAETDYKLRLIELLYNTSLKKSQSSTNSSTQKSGI